MKLTLLTQRRHNHAALPYLYRGGFAAPMKVDRYSRNAKNHYLKWQQPKN